MRRAFSMIELIFVIVIIGILAAFALPKFIGVSNQAHVAKLKDWVGSLNRTVGPEMWGQSMKDGKNGSIKSYTLSNFTDIPKEIDKTTINLNNCGTTDFGASPIAETNATITGSVYDIYCRDGNSTNAPVFELKDSNGNVLLGPST